MLWQDVTFSELDADTLYDILKLRVDIFVVEQECAYPELDDKDRDAHTRHLLGRDDSGFLIAYCRILAPAMSYPEASIGRVAVAKSGRGKGLARELMQRALTVTLAAWPSAGIQIGAQQYLVNFYQHLGFTPCSDMYLEDGIPHVDMRFIPVELPS